MFLPLRIYPNDSPSEGPRGLKPAAQIVAKLVKRGTMCIDASPERFFTALAGRFGAAGEGQANMARRYLTVGRLSGINLRRLKPIANVSRQDFRICLGNDVIA